MTYSEQLPPAALRALAECSWSVVPEPEGRGAVLPDGCMDLVWTGSVLLVAGPDTVPRPTEHGPGRVAGGIRFAPGALPSLLGVPAHALRDQRVPLAELQPALARAATAALAEGGDPAPVLAGIARHLPGAPPPGLVRAVAAAAGTPVRPPPGPVRGMAIAAHTSPTRGVHHLRPGRAAASDAGPEPSAAALADALGVTTRTLHRRCLDAFGYGPAVLRRVLRFRRAMDLLRAGTAPAEVAAAAGYADQPHLSREVRALAGVTPGQVVASGANRSTPLPSGSSTTA